MVGKGGYARSSGGRAPQAGEGRTSVPVDASAVVVECAGLIGSRHLHPRDRPRVGRGGPKNRVRTQRAIHVAARLAVGLVVVVFVAGGFAPAFAVTPPHVVLDSQQSTTDSCAICHRAHTATTVVPYRIDATTTPTGTSLVLSTDPAVGDVQLCFACHGQGQLGSNKDIQSLYELSSVHALAPATAPYGPSPIYCSTCHDSHGTARTATDTPYPRLLRSFEVTAPVYAGEAYCATCHTAANATAMGERFASLAVFMTTGHYSGLSTPTSGTGIRCSWCHDPHGSAVAPLLVASIVPTAVPTTFTVTADNRAFCIACHVPASATWEGSATYTASGHGSSDCDGVHHGDVGPRRLAAGGGVPGLPRADGSRRGCWRCDPQAARRKGSRPVRLLSRPRQGRCVHRHLEPGVPDVRVREARADRGVRVGPTARRSTGAYRSTAARFRALTQRPLIGPKQYSLAPKDGAGWGRERRPLPARQPTGGRPPRSRRT